MSDTDTMWIGDGLLQAMVVDHPVQSAPENSSRRRPTLAVRMPANSGLTQEQIHREVIACSSAALNMPVEALDNEMLQSITEFLTTHLPSRNATHVVALAYVSEVMRDE